MTVIVCRVSWMPFYQSDDESAKGGGGYVDEGNIPHESLNFLPVDGTYHGVVENRGGQLQLANIGGRRTDETIDDVSVVFCAADPESGDYLVTGWYSHATVYRNPIERPGDTLGRCVYFTSTDAKLILESDRCFSIPVARPGRPGGIGQHHVWYGLKEDDEQMAEIRASLHRYMEDTTGQFGAQSPEETVVESRQRKLSERLERMGTYRKRFIESRGYRCEACGWTIDENQKKVWGSSFELHHLVPFAELEEGESREVRIEDFAVLCASCHRGIHRTEYVSDVERFAQEYIR